MGPLKVLLRGIEGPFQGDSRPNKASGPLFGCVWSSLALEYSIGLQFGILINRI